MSTNTPMPDVPEPTDPQDPDTNPDTGTENDQPQR